MYMFRSYSPSLGRWTQRDPIGGINLYKFVYNSPISIVDILGNQEMIISPPPGIDINGPNAFDRASGVQVQLDPQTGFPKGNTLFPSSTSLTPYQKNGGLKEDDDKLSRFEEALAAYYYAELMGYYGDILSGATWPIDLLEALNILAVGTIGGYGTYQVVSAAIAGTGGWGIVIVIGGATIITIIKEIRDALED